MKHVMIDLETLGTDPGCAILSIGATQFNLDGPTGDPFHAKIDPESCQSHGLRIDAGTLNWWLGQDPEAQQVMRGGGPLRHALGLFTEWFPNGAKVWANAPTFDCQILRAAYDAVGAEAPWDYYDERCHRTLKNLPCSPSIKREGTHHNAKDDALHQARVAGATLRILHEGAEQRPRTGGTP